MTGSPTRRRFLQTGALTTLAATAGCLASGSDADAAGQPTDAADTATATDTATDSAGRCDQPAPDLEAPDDVLAWVDDANGYDGEPVRMSRRATIAVGEPTDDGPAFAPPVVEVAPGTNVVWDWTGHGEHNVVALDGTFDSGRTNGQRGTSYSYIFTETGTHAYVSEPHHGEGMRGAILVREPPTTGNERVDRWVRSSSTFDGSVADRTDRESATVTVGAEGNRGHFAFDPVVLRISSGTTVTWEWTGDGSHTVDFEDADISSGEPTYDASATFAHTFESSGTYLYSCLPHQGLGMRGAVIVE